MEALPKKVAAAVMGLFVTAVGFLLFLLLINIIDIRLLKAGYLEGAGISQFIRTYLGGPLLIGVAIGWLALVIFSFDYFSKGVSDNTLIQRFTLVTSVLMYLFPVVVLIYQIAFPVPMVYIDWLMAGGGLVLGSICLYINRTCVCENGGRDRSCSAH